MADADWREILSFSQRELLQADKDKLCESLSWMEADDIELNFSDLKTLFRLAQDILKYKSEQVNNLRGQLEVTGRKGAKLKSRASSIESPTEGSDAVLQTIAHQEEVIKANKEVLEQLYADIAELEGRKNKLQDDKDNTDRESESSRDVLSEINEVAQLENQITLKNRHIRKLLSDVKVLEEENTKLKGKLSVFKDKLTEATNLIENLTEQLYTLNNESSQLKESLGKSEESKAHLTMAIDAFKKELSEKDTTKERIYNDIKTKAQHWKNVAQSKKAKIEALSNENTKLKESLIRASQPQPASPKKRLVEEQKLKELQIKLAEASKKMEQSAVLIEQLKTENRQLKYLLEEHNEMPVSETNNQSDDNKEKALITKLKKKVKSLSLDLQQAEEMITTRDKELADITSQLQLVQTDEGIKTLLDGLKNKKRQLKFKDDGIKTLVLEVNTLNQLVDDLQLENETFRQKLNLPPSEKVPTKGILKDYYEIREKLNKADKCLSKVENKLTQAELDNRVLNIKITKMSKILTELGYSSKIDEIEQESYNHSDLEDEISVVTSNDPRKLTDTSKKCNCEMEMQVIIDENEGLRKGLQEILNFLKNNSTTTSGVLTLECPSLDAILQSMEARHAAGWFAPHMSTIMELRTALGGRDALLTALHEARKETFDVMVQLSKESKKSLELEQKLQEIESKQKEETPAIQEDQNSDDRRSININLGEFGSWMSFEEEDKIDFNDNDQMKKLFLRRNSSYEDYLKKGLGYFHEKFKALFEKMTTIVVQTADQQNKWSIQEEQYKAEIENLKGQLAQQNDDDQSEDSPGLIAMPSVCSLERKCSYLEETYRYIRTLNENMKNEILESKKVSMLMTLDYETQTQSLMLIIANLLDKLRSSIPIDLFWKQNTALNQAVTKHRKLLEMKIKTEESDDLLHHLEKVKIDVIDSIRQHFVRGDKGKTVVNEVEDYLKNAEHEVLQKQLKEICLQLEEKNKRIKNLELNNIEIQESQAKLIDNSMAANTQEEINLMKSQLQKLAEDNKLLKDQCQHIGSQLDIALLQLQDGQRRQLSNDMEINMLRHQILDLQSTGDNKAIIARLSGEVLVAHLQASESHKKIDRLSLQLNKEKQSRAEAEEMLRARQKIFDIYSLRYESKFRYMYEIMQVLRQQYHGSLPLSSLENYLNKVEEFSRKTYAASQKLQDIEDLQFNLMTKHAVFDQVLDLSKNKCLEEEDGCPHKIKNMMIEGIHSREEDHYNKKLNTLEQSQEELRKYCNELENTLILVNQGFEKSNLNIKGIINKKDRTSVLELEDIHSDDDESISRRSQTVTLDKPQVNHTTAKPVIDVNNTNKKKSAQTKIKALTALATEKDNTSDIINKNKIDEVETFAKVSVSTQTVSTVIDYNFKFTQTDVDQENILLNNKIANLKSENDKINKELNDMRNLIDEKVNDIKILNSHKRNLENTIENLKDSNNQGEILNARHRATIDELRKQIDDYRFIHSSTTQKSKHQDGSNEETKTLLLSLKQLENDKNNILSEYQELLQIERNEYSKAVKDLNTKIIELQSKLDSKDSDNNAPSVESLKEVVNKYTIKIANLEDKCFKAQSELDGCKTELVTYQSEVDRWKDLAIERLAKMEQLNSQLEERHCQEVESYKAENQHWLSQFNDTQREHLELRTRITEQKALHMKQLAEKDLIIEQLRSAVHNLKTQIISMQSMISVNDPSFDLSAIVEVDENNDTISHHGSDRLELRFDSSIELPDTDDVARILASSTAVWQEPVIERLRQEKHLAGKQNAILRRQIKALAARERRARLDAQNLKNQIFRISTSGSKVVTAESAALQSKIASLQAQLTSARRDAHSSVALWDKWKRAQQASERWQARFEEKCQEVKRIEGSLNLAKSAVARLEKEKRVLLSRLNELKSEKQSTIEKQDNEALEKSYRPSERDSMCSPPPVSARALLDRVQAQQRRIAALEVAEKVSDKQTTKEKQDNEALEKSHRPSERDSMCSPPPVSARALLDRVQAQQRRIAALEVAEKGNELLVSEYERALAEITSLKGQVLKLESTLLEAQIRTPYKSSQDPQPELDYWKNYCEMLKEENVQLNMRVNALDTAPTTANQHRVNDLEQTVLTLRGLVSKLQAEQKTSVVPRRSDSRPSSGRSSSTDKNRKQGESLRIEITNLKRSLQEKDLLLEKSKEMLKIAAEREDDLLRENTYLRRRIEELTQHRGQGGFLSA